MKKMWRNRLMGAVVSAAMLVTMLPTTAFGASAVEETPAADVEAPAENMSKPAGEGTQEDPYRITGPEELHWFAALVNGTLEGVEQNTSACARLENDISLMADMTEEMSWTPIGFGTDKNGEQTAYTGTFDGGSHVIDTLYLKTDAVDSNVGLFGVNQGTIQNLTVSFASVTCGEIAYTEPNQGNEGGVGVIAGINEGVIADCNVSVAGVRASNHAGTLAGVNVGCIERSAAELAVVIGSVYVGGVTGVSAQEARISEVSFDGSVFGTYITGGIAGENDGTIEDSRFQGYAAALPYESEDGTKSASYYGGGIAGYNFGVIQRCESGVHPSEEPADGQEPEESPETEIRGVMGIGGIAGAGCGTVSDCHNHAAVTGECQETENDPVPRQVGGIVGRIFCYNDPNGSPQRGMVTGCDNYGFVSVGVAETDPGQLQPEDIKEGGYAGGTVGVCLGGAIEDCANHMQVSGSEEIGGIVGYMGDETFAEDGPLCSAVRGCTNDMRLEDAADTFSGRILGITNVGGIAGYVNGPDDRIEDCKNYGMTEAIEQTAGGIAGSIAGGFIEGSFNEGSVSADAYAGGVVGSILPEDMDVSVISCYNQGDITGAQSYAGGITGAVSTAETESGTVKVANCYNTGKINAGEDTKGGLLGDAAYGENKDRILATNCYYLNGCVDGTGISGIEDAESGVYGMDKAAFAGGQITWLLQNGEGANTLVWGQKLPQHFETYDEFPVLAQTEAERVSAVTWLLDNEVVHEAYANPGALLDITVNADITKEGYFLDGWYTDAELTTEWNFAEDTVGVEDLILYGTWVPEEAVLYGDVDENGIVDASDALRILKVAVGLVSADDPLFAFGAADVDGDFFITSEDALLILKKVVRLIDTFPVETEEVSKIQDL